MPDQNGIFKRLERWVARAAAGATNNPVEWDADGDDVATALNNRLCRDGTSSPSADIPFAGHSITGIRQAAVTGEPMEYAQATALIAAAGGSVSNRLHNASFNVNQRAVSGNVSLTAGVYGHDRWKGGASGAVYTFGASGADQALNIGAGSLLQIIPGVDVDSASMTLSQAGTAQARIYQQGGTAPAYAACPVTVTNLTPGQPIVVEFATGTVLRPQIEPGATAHGFARRPIAVDYLACEAFYEVGGYAVFGYTNTTTPSQAISAVNFKVTKASAPTITKVASVNSQSSSGAVSSITTQGFNVSTYSTAAGPFNEIGTFSASCEP